jgi:L-rhamnose-H+ transport protein
MRATFWGLALVTVAAIAGGGIAVPLRKRRVLALENFYAPSTALTMILLPMFFSAILAPQWHSALSNVGAGRTIVAALFGLGWGAGAVLYGYGVNAAGISIACTVIMGTSVAFAGLRE